MPIDVVDMDHVALRVNDLDRALDFYHGLLGLPVRERERFEQGELPYTAVVAGGRRLHLVPTDEEIDVGGEHICLLVRSTAVDAKAELEDMLATLESEGVEIEDGEPKTRDGAYGRAWAAYVRDPDGRRVELKMH
jgi:catechol 2,3-dioxygenase-like lactoylglutathione lyase family enzyme